MLCDIRNLFVANLIFYYPSIIPDDDNSIFAKLYIIPIKIVTDNYGIILWVHCLLKPAHGSMPAQ